MSDYTINDSIFKLLFGAVGVAVHNMRVRHAKRRLDRAFEYANRLSNNPTDNFCHCLEVNGVLYIRAFQQLAKELFEDILDKMEMERNENENTNTQTL